MMYDLSVIIPARNEEFLAQTVKDVLGNRQAKTEVIVICDGNWPDPPIKDHSDITMIHHSESIGQRAAVNEGAKLSTAKYIMKLDAHCAVDNGFDVKLMTDCAYDWTVLPRMYTLIAFKWVCEKCGKEYGQGPQPTCCGGNVKREIIWKRNKRKKSDYMWFDKDLRIGYFDSNYLGKHGDVTKLRAMIRPKLQQLKPQEISDVMCGVGACWFMHKDRFWELGGMDEKHGSWGQVAVEIACKAWLSGGRHVVNKKTWFAHLFRTQAGFSWPYPMTGRQQERARKYSRKLWKGNRWEKQKRPLEWLIDKFGPLPSWEKATVLKGIVYYTDNHCDELILQACRKQLMRAVNGFELVSVSQTPLDFGKNIVMNLQRSKESMFRQILKGLEESTADVIFLAEHDLLYHPSHFDFMPERDDTFYYDRNRWAVCSETGKAVFYHTNCPSLMCAYRELLIKHYRLVLEYIEKNGVFRSSYGFSPPKGVPKEAYVGRSATYFSEHPTIDIRHDKTLTRKRMNKEQFRSPRSRKGWTEAFEVPGWGQTGNRIKDFLIGIKEGHYADRNR